jgi:hypothetical protein
MQEIEMLIGRHFKKKREAKGLSEKREFWGQYIK